MPTARTMARAEWVGIRAAVEITGYKETTIRTYVARTLSNTRANPNARVLFPVPDQRISRMMFWRRGTLEDFARLPRPKLGRPRKAAL